MLQFHESRNILSSVGRTPLILFTNPYILIILYSPHDEPSVPPDGSLLSEKNENDVETNPNAGGCFANVEVDGDYLVYRAYVVNDDTQKVTMVDEYAIKKTVKDGDIEDTKLPTDFIGSLDGTVANFFTEIFGLIFTYIGKLLPQIIGGLF